MCRREAAQAQALPAHLRPAHHLQDETRDDRHGPRAGRAAGRRRGGTVAAAVQARPRAREAAPGTQEGEARHAHPGPHHGLLHRVLAALLHALHPNAALLLLRYPREGLRHCLLARLHELRAQPRHLHSLQQGLPARVSTHPLQMMFGAALLLCRLAAATGRSGRPGRAY